jgi:hypothetical protein
MSRHRLFQARAGDAPADRPNDGRLHSDEFPDRQDPLVRELRSLYAAPGERYWDDFEGRILAAVRAGTANAARPARAAADFWQALAVWARPGLAAAAVLAVVATAVGIQARASRANVAEASSPGGELRPLDPELARALDDSGLDSVSAAAARAAQEAAYLLTGGLKRRAPVQIDAPADEASSDTRARLTDEKDEVQRARREATFRYVMPD